MNELGSPCLSPLSGSVGSPQGLSAPRRSQEGPLLKNRGQILFVIVRTSACFPLLQKNKEQQ